VKINIDTRPEAATSSIPLAIKKYGAENFELTTLAHPRDLEEMNLGEECHILSRHTLAPLGYNLKPGGLNHAVHEETRIKLSLSHLGKKFPYRKRVARTQQAIENHRKSMMGHSTSQETRDKISKANMGNKNSLGVVRSEEERSAISLRQKNPKNLELLTRARSLRVYGTPWNKGKKATPEAILHQSLAHKGNHYPKIAAAQLGRIPWNKGIKHANSL
jgi:hypothetical protein